MTPAEDYVESAIRSYKVRVTAALDDARAEIENHLGNSHAALRSCRDL
jgi:hypothetical protein